MNSKIVNIILALLIFLPTCAYIPLYLYLVLFIVCIYLNYSFLKDFTLNLFKGRLIDKNFGLLIIFSLMAFVFRLSDYPKWESVKDIYSFAYLFPFTYLVARSLKGRNDVFKYIIYFVIVEVLFSILEYAIGVSTVFIFHKNCRIFESYELLYNTRTYGLGVNSSLLSFKYIFCLIFLGIVKFSKTRATIIEILLLIGSVLTFGRIALVVVFFFLLLRLIDSVFVKKNFKILNQVPFILLLLFFSVNPNWTLKQFSRNSITVTNSRISTDELGDNGLTAEETFRLTRELGLDKIDMSGRNEIWNTFLTYSSKHLVVGSKGKKMIFGKYHAHNSFIELLASFGIFMFLLMMFIILKNITINNYVFIFTIGLLSIGQYLVFWGMSIFDVLFYYLIFFYKKNES